MITHLKESPDLLDGKELEVLRPLVDICEYVRWFENPSLIADWKVVREPAAAFAAADEKGLNAYLFEGTAPHNRGQQVLAFEPTKTAAQWKTNVRQALYAYPDDYRNAYELTLAVKKSAEEAGKRLVLTGNSKGGGEAMFAAAKARVPAVAFNPASLGPATQQQLSREDVAWGDSHIKVAVMENDLIDKMNRAASLFRDQGWVGTVHRLPRPEGLDEHMIPGTWTRAIRTAAESHAADSLRLVVNDQRYRLDPHFFKEAPPETPIAHPVIAHRGASNEYPENTLPAFDAAWKKGADGIELDVHLTSDGQIVVHHDSNTLRQTGQSHRISETPLATLRDLDAGQSKGKRFAGTQIPLLRDVLARVPKGKKVFIEMKGKSDRIVGPLLETLHESKLDPKQFTIIGFSLPLVSEVHRRVPGIETLWLCGERPGLGRTGAGSFYIQTDGRLLSPSRIVAEAKAAGVDGIDIDASRIDARRIDHRLIREAQIQGLKVAAWTVDAQVATPEQREHAAAKIRRLNTLGVAVTTNDPALARQAIQPKPSEIRRRKGIVLDHAELRTLDMRRSARLEKRLSSRALYTSRREALR